LAPWLLGNAALWWAVCWCRKWLGSGEQSIANSGHDMSVLKRLQGIPLLVGSDDVISMGDHHKSKTGLPWTIGLIARPFCSSVVTAM